MTNDQQANAVLEAMAEHERQFSSQFAVDDATGTFLYSLVLQSRPERILELGTWRGASAIYMAVALKEIGKGELVTVDVGNDRIDVVEQNIQQAGVSKYVRFVPSSIDKHLAKDTGVYDLVFLDAEKRLQGLWLQTILAHNVREGSIIVVDDVITMAGRMQDLLSSVEVNPRLEHEIREIGDGLLVIKVLEV